MLKGGILVLASLLGTVLLARESFARGCYECTDCDSIDGKFDRQRAKIVDCNGSCQKIIQDTTGVQRGCFGYGDTEGCKRVDATKTTTCICNSNLCNLATKLEMSLTVLFVVMATAVYQMVF